VNFRIHLYNKLHSWEVRVGLGCRMLMAGYHHSVLSLRGADGNAPQERWTPHNKNWKGREYGSD